MNARNVEKLSDVIKVFKHMNSHLEKPYECVTCFIVKHFSIPVIFEDKELLVRNLGNVTNVVKPKDYSCLQSHKRSHTMGKNPINARNVGRPSLVTKP